jgi:hypothetical protein
MLLAGLLATVPAQAEHQLSPVLGIERLMEDGVITIELRGASFIGRQRIKKALATYNYALWAYGAPVRWRLWGPGGEVIIQVGDCGHAAGYAVLFVEPKLSWARYYTRPYVCLSRRYVDGWEPYALSLTNHELTHVLGLADHPGCQERGLIMGGCYRRPAYPSRGEMRSLAQRYGWHLRSP